MSGHWHCLRNRKAVHGPVVEITVSVKNPRFLRSQIILNYERKIVHNCLNIAVTSLMYHGKYSTTINSFCFSKSLLLGCKCVQFQ